MSRLRPVSSSFTWDRTTARHLLNRGGFGVPLSRVETMRAAGLQRCVQALVHYDQFPDTVSTPEFTSVKQYEAMREQYRGADDMARREAINKAQRQMRQEIDRMKGWWMEQMRTTPRPLQEKMALFWHGHFATSAREIKQPEYNHDLNQVFRTHATGNFKTLTFAVGKSPAMLNYLNNKQNRKGHPNENWARELMELFTLGIGNYTEEDIREAARAFTGYTERRGEFHFDSNQHDYGPKTFLGRTGEFDGADIVNIIFEQDAAARFVPRKLWEFFVYENPDEAIVDELAETFRGANFELKPLLEKIFLSEEFYSPRAMNAQIKSPTQYLLMLADQLNFQQPPGAMANIALRGLGQELFYPPNVKGWPGGREWIDTNTLMLRCNIPAYVMLGERPAGVRSLELDEAGVEQAARAAAQARPAAARGRRIMDLRPLLANAPVTNAGAAVDLLCDRFLGRPVDPARRAVLVQALTGTSNDQTPFNVTNTDTTRLAGTVHLIVSTAEYQLC